MSSLRLSFRPLPPFTGKGWDGGKAAALSVETLPPSPALPRSIAARERD